MITFVLCKSSPNSTLTLSEQHSGNGTGLRHCQHFPAAFMKTLSSRRLLLCCWILGSIWLLAAVLNTHHSAIPTNIPKRKRGKGKLGACADGVEIDWPQDVFSEEGARVLLTLGSEAALQTYRACWPREDLWRDVQEAHSTPDCWAMPWLLNLTLSARPPRETGLFVDAGMNQGACSLPALAAGHRVKAFEAHGEAIAIVMQSVLLNQAVERMNITHTILGDTTSGAAILQCSRCDNSIVGDVERYVTLFPEECNAEGAALPMVTKEAAWTTSKREAVAKQVHCKECHDVGGAAEVSHHLLYLHITCSTFTSVMLLSLLGECMRM